MSPDKHDEHSDEADQIIRKFSDASGLRDRGVDEQWIQNCAALADQFRRLQRQFRELESELSRSEPGSSDDTIVL